MEDLDLVKNIQENSCDASLKVLINRHSALCLDISKKYSPALNASGISMGDIFDEKDYLVYKSALSFDPEKKVKFSTWLGNQVRYHCLNTINGNNKKLLLENEKIDFMSEGSIECSELQTKEQSNSNLKIEIDYIFEILSKLPAPRIKEVFNLRYFSSAKKTPWAKIAKQMGISTQTAINLHQRGINILNKKMTKSNKPDLI